MQFSDIKIMKLSLIFLVLIVFHHAQCSKKLKFLKVHDCSSKNTVIEIEKCEVDDIYVSVKVNIKTPIVKSIVSNKKNTLTFKLMSDILTKF